jgi:ABC-type dipeptide/oligopeptide/nickel transport system permease subunit
VTQGRAALLLLALIVVAGVFAPILSPSDPTEQHLDSALSAPGSRGFLLGSDDLGRDILSRVLHGARAALTVAGVAVGFALLTGSVLGLAAGLLGGRTEALIMGVMNGILSFPTVLLAITVIAAFGNGLIQVMGALGVVFTPIFARLVRAEVRSLKRRPFVLASQLLGASLRKVVRFHLLPMLMPRLMAQAATTAALAIGIEASLSFLGLGTQPPTPSWGIMLKDARNYLLTAPWMALAPGGAMAATIASLHLLADSYSRRWAKRSE